MEVKGNIGASCESVYGIAYLDFHQNFLVDCVEKNVPFHSQRVEICYNNTYTKFVDELNTEKFGCIPLIKAFNDRNINIAYKNYGYIRLSTETGAFYEDDEVEDNNNWNLIITGSEEFVTHIITKTKQFKRRNNLSWYYLNTRGDPESVDIKLEFNQNIFDEHYPYLTVKNEQATVNEFASDYMKSKASILILNGSPGTGKTTFLRYLIDRFNQKAIVTYDEKILKDEKFFINFLTKSSAQILIIEDAELILTSRTHDGNKIMSKLLNVSDGLVKLFNKKIIFTTNESNVTNFDPAILRPGRCYEMVNFRELTLDEANDVCRVNNLPLQKKNKQYTLAQLFNQNTEIKQSKAGFLKLG